MPERQISSRNCFVNKMLRKCRQNDNRFGRIDFLLAD